jgi:uncharacterized repeat protein (TIGR03806 family)
LLLQRCSTYALAIGGALLLALACGNGDDNGGNKPAATGGSSGTGGTAGAGGTTTGGSAGTGVATGGSSGTAAGSAGSPAAGSAGSSGTGGSAGTGTGPGGEAGMDATGGTAGSGAGGKPTWGVETRPTGQTCIAPTTEKTQPTKLSMTGCVDPMDPTKPAATLIPYAVSTPLWSDAAEKTRYFALPDNGMIKVKDCSIPDAPECKDPQSGGGNYEDNGDWDFPDGTVFMKTFGFDGKLVETRLLVRKDEFDWWGYSYHWNAEQTDADLWEANTDGNDEVIHTTSRGDVNWHYPSRGQCLQCHVTAAGVSLGPETSQLNYEWAYPNGVTGNQLETLKHLGIFSNEPPALPVYPAPSDSTKTAEERAKAYLHINCGICHRPGGNFTDFDARYGTPLIDMLLCGKPAEKAVPASYMLDMPLRIDPGHPETSVVSLRMHDVTDFNFRMPQIGSRVLDADGTKAVDDWITAMTACP